MKMQPIFTGMFFSDVPFDPTEGISTVEMGDERYNIMTATVRGANNMVMGYVQLGDVERLQLGEIPFRGFLYLLVSIAISALTFGVGLFFARRSLKPAAQAMERLEQFTQDASHELRTPLAALNSSLDLAVKTKKYQEGIHSAKEDLSQIAGLTERLLELARLDALALQKESTDVSHLVQDTLESMTALAKENNVTIERKIAESIRVTVDSALLRQVLTNLVSNAIKFRKPEGGTITVTLKKNLLSVADTGIGMTEEQQSHIFDRFYRADDSRTSNGFGLGLALVKRISDVHGWDVDVNSKKDVGTTFTIKFS
jgi:signal transduction histidine kinase